MIPKLFAPKEYGQQPCCYHKASPELIKEATGGCGPGGPGDKFVPDKLCIGGAILHFIVT